MISSASPYVATSSMYVADAPIRFCTLFIASSMHVLQ